MIKRARLESEIVRVWQRAEQLNNAQGWLYSSGVLHGMAIAILPVATSPDPVTGRSYYIPDRLVLWSDLTFLELLAATRGAELVGH